MGAKKVMSGDWCSKTSCSRTVTRHIIIQYCVIVYYTSSRNTTICQLYSECGYILLLHNPVYIECLRGCRSPDADPCEMKHRFRVIECGRRCGCWMCESEGCI